MLAPSFSVRRVVHKGRLKPALLASVALLAAGCTLAPSVAEKQARDDVARIGRQLPPVSSAAPHAAVATAPVPGASAPLEEFVQFSVLRHPAVAAAYYDWRASVEAIAPTRALPDPQLTFEADIAETLMTFMPGLMFDVMAPVKRAAMASEATAKTGVAYRAYVTSVLRTAAAVRNAWIELAYAEETRRLYSATIQNIEQSLALASAEYSTGRSMVSLEQMVRLRNTVAEHHAHHAAVSDRLAAARARFKSALGLAPADADPAWPSPELRATPLPAEDELWRRALAANPELGSMRAMVDMALAEIEVANLARTPDFALGAMADLKANPLMVRPTAAVKLPIWREKIAANIAAAQSRRDAAVARVGAEELNLAAELAQMLFMVRDADRMIAYITDTALPNLDQLAASSAAGYQSGMGSAAMIPDARHMALAMQLERVRMLRERELAAANLLVLITGHAPAGAPLLAQTDSR